jgi:sulfite reductase beta subunit-like hemoprotein
MEPSTTTGRKGSIENPEVREDVPGHVIPILRREFDDFDNEAEKFLAGDMEETDFIGFRLKQGVYGQRQPDVQMVRVKLPFGGVSPEQMDAFASVVEQYAPLKKGHITTRQNIQIHHVPLRDAAALIRELSDAGLSSREGCGNTVRNVTADPWAGVCHDELWDPTPFAGAYVRYFVRHPTTQLMPRKVKTAFTGSETDRALTGIHDIAFIARERDGVRGFEIRVGGGTSIMPRVAPTLVDFVTAEDGEYLKWAEAVLRIFDRQDWLRVNRARARIKVLVDKIGIDALREQVEEELQGDWVGERDFSVDERLFLHDEEANAPAPPLSYGSPNGDGSEFERFHAANVEPQRQAGFSTVQVKVTRGDLTPEQLRGLADIMREYCGGYARRLRRLAATDGAGRGRRGRRPGQRRRLLPRDRLLQARHHELDGPQPGGPGADRVDEHHRSADARHPHQDVRLPQRLQPAPHRQHRVLRRVDQGRAAHHPGLRRAHRRQLRGRRDRLRRAPGGAAAGQARARGRRALDPRLRGRARGRRGLQRVRRADRYGGVRGQGARPRDAGRVRARDDEPLHRLDQEGPVRGRPRRRRVRGLTA